jgi:hypothetical protein
VSEFALVVARPENLALCLPEPFASVVDGPALILFVGVDGRYLADVNDDPDGEDDYDLGLKLWATCVVALYDLLAGTTGGTGLQFDADVARRRGSAGHVSVQARATIDRAMILGLSSMGGQATMWTAADRSTWWLAAGYKEPYLVVGGDIEPDSLGRRLGERVGLPVVHAQTAFVPHRVRLHAEHDR